MVALPDANAKEEKICVALMPTRSHNSTTFKYEVESEAVPLASRVKSPTGLGVRQTAMIAYMEITL
jgi:hypothetical protein